MRLRIDNIKSLPTPCYLIDYDYLLNNIKLAKKRCEVLNVKMLLSIKGFPLYSIFEDISPYFDGVSASSLFEAKAGQLMKKEVHIHSPVYSAIDFEEISSICDHIVFNSISQLKIYGPKIDECKKIGLRINPEYSEVAIEKYNPCCEYSRFGVTQTNLCNNTLPEIGGLHMHTMCENEAESFARIINKTSNKFNKLFEKISWINFGGGQLITEPNYNLECLKQPINNLINNYRLKIYIEPCESLVSESGFLVATVLDIIDNGKLIAILDTSAVCHMPEILEMPYTPDIEYPTNSRDCKYPYIIAGNSCLAGDIIGEYFFENPLKIGDKIVFSEMGAYTFCKANYFNGINLPTIALYKNNSLFQILKQYNYENYKSIY